MLERMRAAMAMVVLFGFCMRATRDWRSRRCAILCVVYMGVWCKVGAVSEQLCLSVSGVEEAESM